MLKQSHIWPNHACAKMLAARVHVESPGDLFLDAETEDYSSSTRKPHDS